LRSARVLNTFFAISNHSFVGTCGLGTLEGGDDVAVDTGDSLSNEEDVDLVIVLPVKLDTTGLVAAETCCTAGTSGLECVDCAPDDDAAEEDLESEECGDDLGGIQRGNTS